MSKILRDVFFCQSLSNLKRLLIRRRTGMEKSRALCRGLGNVLTTSALLMGTLAFGLDPFKAAGYTCVLWMLLLADMAFRDKTYLGESSPRVQIVLMLFSALFGAGFLA